MVCGVPIISTEVAGVGELIEHQKNGHLVEQRNSTALADAMQLLSVLQSCGTTSPARDAKLCFRASRGSRVAQRYNIFRRCWFLRSPLTSREAGCYDCFGIRGRMTSPTRTPRRTVAGWLTLIAPSA